MPDRTPPMSDRDRLAEFAWERLAGPGSVGTAAAEIRYSADRVADIAVAAGWRPPARVIESIEELNTLAEGVVVLDARQIVQEVDLVNEVGTYRACWWISPGSEFSRPSEAVALPATVLHIPTQEGA